MLVQYCLASRNQVQLVRDASSVQSDIEAIVNCISSSFPGSIFYELRAGISTGTRMLLWQRIIWFDCSQTHCRIWRLESVAATGATATVVKLSVTD